MKDRRRFTERVLFLIFCIHLPAQTVTPLDQWNVVANPAQSLRGMAYKDGTFVAVGYSTNIVVSTNATNWFKASSGLTNGGLYAVAEGAGRFVAVGPGNFRGTILSSTDGLEWTQRFAQTNEEYWAVTYGGGQFVAVGFPNYWAGSNSVALTSTDGEQWQRFLLPFNTTPRNVVYGAGVYVAAGAPLSLYSTNGRDWLPLNSILAQSVAYGGGQFIATRSNEPHGTFRSTNGVDWTEVLIPATPAINFYTAGYANGTFVLAGEGAQTAVMATSTNGADWTFRTFTNNNDSIVIRDMVFVDGSFFVADQSRGRIWKSGRMAPSARPFISRIVRQGVETTVTFTSLPGFRYVVERAEHLGAIDWIPWTESAFATGDNITVSGSSSNAMQFYRVRTQ